MAKFKSQKIKDEVLHTINQYALHSKDKGSTVVQLALLTRKINLITIHLKNNKKDQSCLRGLQVLIGKRRRLLKYLKGCNINSYTMIKDQLDL